MQAGNLFVGQEAENCVGAFSLTVDNIPSAGVNRILNVAGVFRHIVVYGFDTTLRVAAAGSQLRRQTSKAPFRTISGLKNCSVYAVKALTKRLLNARLTEFDIVEAGKHRTVVKADRNIVGSGKSSNVVATRKAVKAAAIAAPAVITPAAAQKQKQENPPAIAAKAIVIAIVSVAPDSITFRKRTVIVVHSNVLQIYLYRAQIRRHLCVDILFQAHFVCELHNLIRVNALLLRHLKYKLFRRSVADHIFSLCHHLVGLRVVHHLAREYVDITAAVYKLQNLIKRAVPDIWFLSVKNRIRHLASPFYL